MYRSKRPLSRPALLIFLAATFVLAACGAVGTNNNWPGLSTNGENVFVAYGPGILAVNAETGQEVWSFPEEPNARLPFYAAPSWQDGRLVIGNYGASGGIFSPTVVVSIFGLKENDRQTPDILWQEDSLAHDRIVAPPLQVGSQAFVATANNMLFALDAETGAVNWQFEAGHAIWGQPTYKNGVILVSSLDRNVYALDAVSGEEIWRQTFSGAISGAPVVNENLVYIANFDSKIHALDIDTGEEKWTAVANDWIWSSPAYADGIIYYADAKGDVFAVNGRTGEEIWMHQIDRPVQSSPVVAGNVLYIASDGTTEELTGQLTALSLADGSEMWTQLTPAGLFSTPVVSGDNIVVALQSETALLIAFNLETGAKAWETPPPG